MCNGQVLEADNAVALQLRLSDRHPHTLTLLHNFVQEKTALLGGERPSEAPRGILELQAHDNASCDLLQQVYATLAAAPLPPAPRVL